MFDSSQSHLLTSRLTDQITEPICPQALRCCIRNRGFLLLQPMVKPESQQLPVLCRCVFWLFLLWLLTILITFLSAEGDTLCFLTDFGRDKTVSKNLELQFDLLIFGALAGFKRLQVAFLIGSNQSCSFTNRCWKNVKVLNSCFYFINTHAHNINDCISKSDHSLLYSLLVPSWWCMTVSPFHRQPHTRSRELFLFFTILLPTLNLMIFSYNVVCVCVLALGTNCRWVTEAWFN